MSYSGFEIDYQQKEIAQIKFQKTVCSPKQLLYNSLFWNLPQFLP